MTDLVTAAARPFVASAAVQRAAAASLRTAQPAADLVSLAMGEPGFDTPPSIRLTAHASIEAGHTHYAHPNRDPELREALAGCLNREHVSDYSTEQILVTHGGTGGLAAPGRPPLGPRRPRRRAGRGQGVHLLRPVQPDRHSPHPQRTHRPRGEARGGNTIVVSDEAYNELVDTETPFVSTLDIAGLVERTSTAKPSRRPLP